MKTRLATSRLEGVFNIHFYLTLTLEVVDDDYMIQRITLVVNNNKISEREDI